VNVILRPDNRKEFVDEGYNTCLQAQGEKERQPIKAVPYASEDKDECSCNKIKQGPYVWQVCNCNSCNEFAISNDCMEIKSDCIDSDFAGGYHEYDGDGKYAWAALMLASEPPSPPEGMMVKCVPPRRFVMNPVNDLYNKNQAKEKPKYGKSVAEAAPQPAKEDVKPPEGMTVEQVVEEMGAAKKPEENRIWNERVMANPPNMGNGEEDEDEDED
jgi:hypothetical protein